MNKNRELKLYVIPSLAPHAARSVSSENFGMLVEYASGSQRDVESVEVI